VIISIFAIRGMASVLAHVTPHRVAGITLPPADATPLFFIDVLALSGTLEKKFCYLFAATKLLTHVSHRAAKLSASLILSC